MTRVQALYRANSWTQRVLKALISWRQGPLSISSRFQWQTQSWTPNKTPSSPTKIWAGTNDNPSLIPWNSPLRKPRNLWRLLSNHLRLLWTSRRRLSERSRKSRRMKMMMTWGKFLTLSTIVHSNVTPWHPTKIKKIYDIPKVKGQWFHFFLYNMNISRSDFPYIWIQIPKFSIMTCMF